MKKNIFFRMLFVVPALMLGCDDDETGVSTDLGTIASTYYEKDGAGTVTIPFRNPSGVSNLSVVFGGTATEGEDYSLAGITDEGVQLSINDDSKFEPNETIRVQLKSASGSLKGNTIHTVTIVSNCADTDELDEDFFVGEFVLYEDDYGPYITHIEQDETNPNKYWLDNFFDSGLPAYIVYDPATKTVSFPQQTPVATFPTRIITSTPATIDNNCSFEITTSYRGATWQNIFNKVQFAAE